MIQKIYHVKMGGGISGIRHKIFASQTVPAFTFFEGEVLQIGDFIFKGGDGGITSIQDLQPNEYGGQDKADKEIVRTRAWTRRSPAVNLKVVCPEEITLHHFAGHTRRSAEIIKPKREEKFYSLLDKQAKLIESQYGKKHAADKFYRETMRSKWNVHIGRRI